MIILLTCLAWTCLQALPLPCAIVKLLGPTSFANTTASLPLLGEQPRFCTLSRDPGATQLEILKLACVVCVVAAARALAVRGLRQHVIIAVAWSTVAIALVALGHALFSADKVFGVYAPTAKRTAVILAPLINENHLGGFVAVGAPLCAY